MPFYNLHIGGATNPTTANTEQSNMTARTGTGAVRIGQLSMGPSFAPGGASAAGGIRFRLASFATPGTGGSAPNGAIALDPNNPASTLINDQNSPVTGPGTGARRTHVTVGAAQRGANGFWAARSREAAVALDPNAGANGNADLLTIGTTVAYNFEGNLIFEE